MPKKLVRMIGEEDLLKALAYLAEYAQAALEDAARAGAEVIRREAAANAPGPHVVSEVIEKGNGTVEVGIAPDEEHWYYKFFETGADAHEIKGQPLLAWLNEAGVQQAAGGVTNPGLPAKPYLRPALNSQADAARDAVADKLRQAILPAARGD